ncbi:MAG TPA: hypothetical protein VIK72_03760 [Clostridiaceae bacterium]
MKRKKELYDEIKLVEKEIKFLSKFVQEEEYLPTEDELHSWVIKMDVCIKKLEEVKEQVVDFYRN